MVLPVLVAVALGLVWLLALAATQVRVVDAAREAARAAARDDAAPARSALGRRVAPRRRAASPCTTDGGTGRGPGARPRCADPVGCSASCPASTCDAEAVAAAGAAMRPAPPGRGRRARQRHGAGVGLVGVLAFATVLVAAVGGGGRRPAAGGQSAADLAALAGAGALQDGSRRVRGRPVPSARRNGGPAAVVHGRRRGGHGPGDAGDPPGARPAARGPAGGPGRAGDVRPRAGWVSGR